MGRSVAPLLSRTTSRVTLHYVDLGHCGILGRTIRKLTRKAARGKCALANCFAGFTRSLASTCGVEALIYQSFSDLWVSFEIIFELFASYFLHYAVNLSVGELGFSLTFEAWLWDLDRDDGCEALTGVFTREVRFFVLDQIIGLSVGINYASQCGAEARKVCATFNIVNRICVGVDLVIVAVVILESDIHNYVSVEVRVGCRRFAMKADRVGMEDVLIFVKKGDVFRDTIFEDEGLGFVDSFIDEGNFYARIEEGELP